LFLDWIWISTINGDILFGIWDLGFGIWDLGFGIWVKSAFPGALLDVEKFMKKLQEKG
jgi:hypothetical protein